MDSGSLGQPSEKPATVEVKNETDVVRDEKDGTQVKSNTDNVSIGKRSVSIKHSQLSKKGESGNEGDVQHASPPETKSNKSGDNADNVSVAQSIKNSQLSKKEESGNEDAVQHASRPEIKSNKSGDNADNVSIAQSIKHSQLSKKEESGNEDDVQHASRQETKSNKSGDSCAVFVGAKHTVKEQHDFLENMLSSLNKEENEKCVAELADSPTKGDYIDDGKRVLYDNTERKEIQDYRKSYVTTDLGEQQVFSNYGKSTDTVPPITDTVPPITTIQDSQQPLLVTMKVNKSSTKKQPFIEPILQQSIEPVLQHVYNNYAMHIDPCKDIIERMTKIKQELENEKNFCATFRDKLQCMLHFQDGQCFARYNKHYHCELPNCCNATAKELPADVFEGQSSAAKTNIDTVKCTTVQNFKPCCYCAIQACRPAWPFLCARSCYFRRPMIYDPLQSGCNTLNFGNCNACRYASVKRKQPSYKSFFEYNYQNSLTFKQDIFVDAFDKWVLPGPNDQKVYEDPFEKPVVPENCQGNNHTFNTVQTEMHTKPTTQHITCFSSPLTENENDNTSKDTKPKLQLIMATCRNEAINEGELIVYRDPAKLMSFCKNRQNGDTKNISSHSAKETVNESETIDDSEYSVNEVKSSLWENLDNSHYTDLQPASDKLSESNNVHGYNDNEFSDVVTDSIYYISNLNSVADDHVVYTNTVSNAATQRICSPTMYCNKAVQVTIPDTQICSDLKPSANAMVCRNLESTIPKNSFQIFSANDETITDDTSNKNLQVPTKNNFCQVNMFAEQSVENSTNTSDAFAAGTERKFNIAITSGQSERGKNTDEPKSLGDKIQSDIADVSSLRLGTSGMNPDTQISTACSKSSDNRTVENLGSANTTSGDIQIEADIVSIPKNNCFKNNMNNIDKSTTKTLKTTVDPGLVKLDNAEFDVSVDTYVDKMQRVMLLPGKNNLGRIIVEVNLDITEDQNIDRTDDLLQAEEHMKQLYEKFTTPSCGFLRNSALCPSLEHFLDQSLESKAQ